MSPKIDKAQQLVETGRCHTITCDPDNHWVGSIEGDHGAYLVTYVKPRALASLFEQGIPVSVNTSCTCEHSKHSRGLCSHIIAAGAMLAQAAQVAA